MGQNFETWEMTEDLFSVNKNRGEQSMKSKISVVFHSLLYPVYVKQEKGEFWIDFEPKCQVIGLDFQNPCGDIRNSEILGLFQSLFSEQTNHLQ